MPSISQVVVQLWLNSVLCYMNDKSMAAVVARLFNQAYHRIRP